MTGNLNNILAKIVFRSVHLFKHTFGCFELHVIGFDNTENDPSQSHVDGNKIITILAEQVQQSTCMRRTSES